MIINNAANLPIPFLPYTIKRDARDLYFKNTFILEKGATKNQIASYNIENRIIL